MSFQQWSAIGNLTDDPELKYVGEGTPKTTFSVAINRKTRDGEKALFVDVECWRDLAEQVAEYLRKGRKVFLLGEWDMDEWTDRETSQKRRKWYVRAHTVRFLDKPESNGERPRREDRPERRDDNDNRDSRGENYPF